MQLARFYTPLGGGPRLVAVPVPGAADGAAELGVVMDLPPPVSQEVGTQLPRSQAAARLYPNHRLVFADFALVGDGNGDAARHSLKMFGQPRMHADWRKYYEFYGSSGQQPMPLGCTKATRHTPN